MSGDNDDCYIVRYPACSVTVPSGRMECVPAEDVREARGAPPATTAKRPSPEEPRKAADGASCCKKAKRTGQGIPMDALLRYIEALMVHHPDAELPPAPKQP